MNKFSKKIFSVSTWENLLIRFLRFFIKRNPVGLINESFNNHHPYWSIAISATLIFSLIISSFWFGFLRNPEETEAAWWNDSWQYRRAVPITNTSIVDQTDVYATSTIDTSDSVRFKANCGDLRFTKVTGELLPYYIVSGCGTSTTIVHVNFDTFPMGNQTIYYYYGNPDAMDGFSSNDFTTEISNYTVGDIAAEEVGNGPVAYWSFDEGYGTTAYDSNNINSGTLTNMSTTASSTSGWQTEDRCVSGKCLAFDGDNDYVNAGDDASLNFGSGSFTITSWLKINSFPSAAYAGIVSKRGGSGGYWQFTTGNDAIHFYVHDLSIARDTNVSPNIGEWYLVTAIIDRDSDLLKLSLNGGSFSTVSITGLGTIGDNADPVRIGWEKANNRYFDGTIDEVKIYPYARTAAQIKMDYNAGLAGTGGSGSSNAGVAVSAGGRSPKWISDGLVGHWKMDEATWDGTTNEVTDWSGNGNHGTAAGTASITAGKFGNGGVFDGVNDYIDCGSEASLGITSGSFLAWFKANATQHTNARIIEIGAVSNRIGLYIKDSDKLAFYLINNGSLIFDLGSSPTVTDDEWHFAVATWDNTGAKLYIDGIEQDSFFTGDATSNLPTPTTYIGEYISGGNYYFKGLIDEVRIYDRALSDREVRDLYNYAPGPVGYWNFEEGSGTTANDISGNGNVGTLTNGPTWTTGKIGKGIDFDGVDDYVDAGNDGSVRLTGDDTLEVWVKPNIGSTGNFIQKDGGTGDRGWYLSILDTGVIRTAVAINATAIAYFDTDASLTDGVWSHIARVYDGSTIKVYINGVEQSGTQNGTIPATQRNSNSNVKMGAISTFYLNGSIDEVKIYNYARTQKQIMQDMGGGPSAVSASPVAVTASGKTTVGYWKFDEGYGTNQYDSSPQKNHATSTGASWTNNGKFGKALSFDGNDFVSIADDDSLDFTNAITIGMWINLTSTAQIDLISKSVSDSDENFGAMIKTNSIYWDYGGSTAYVVADFFINTNEWHYIALTVKSGEFGKVYLDGVETDYSSLAGVAPTPLLTNNQPIIIGATEYGRPNFSGLIDEVKIYNYALTEDEVRLDYNRGSTLRLGSYSQSSTGVASSSAASLYCVPGSTDVCSPPVGEWKFEEGSGTTANDTSDNNNTGTLNGGPTWTNGKIGKGLKLDGVDDYVDVANGFSNTISGKDVWSVEMWVKLDVMPSNTWYVLYSSEIITTQHGAIKNNGIIRLASNGDIDSASGEIVAGTWYHLAWVRTAADSGKIYKNGAEIQSGALGAMASATNDDLNIGEYADSNFGLYSFNGKIDDVKIYDYARTAAQIAWDYNKGKPVAHWKFDECQGTTAYDSSGNNNHGTLFIGTGGTQTATGTCATSGTAWGNGASGKRNSSLSFDGTDDYVDMGNNGNLSFGTGNFAIETWFKTSADVPVGQYDGILAKYASGSNVGPWIQIDGNGFLIFGWDGSISIQGDTAVNDGVWHHIVAQRTDSTSAELYLDGVLHKSIDSAPSASSDSAANLDIGRIDMAGRYFNGNIDDVQIYNYALTPVQVKNLYTGGAVRFGQ